MCGSYVKIKRLKQTSTGLNVRLQRTANAGNVIIVWSSVQCETVYSAVNGQAGTLWMEGIMWPQHLPKQIFLTDCQQAHTRDQPIKTIPKCDLKWARRAQKHLMYRLQMISVACGDLGRACDAFLKRFYEWRLWYVNECDWEKKMASSSFSTLWHCRNRLEGFFMWEKAEHDLQHDFNRWLCSEIMADSSYIHI